MFYNPHHNFKPIKVMKTKAGAAFDQWKIPLTVVGHEFHIVKAKSQFY